MHVDLTQIPIDQIFGVAGFATYVLSYGLLTLDRITSQMPIYFALNFLAATLVLVSLTGAFNLASLLIQLFWIVVSVIGITLRLRRPTKAARQKTAPRRVSRTRRGRQNSIAMLPQSV